MERIKELYDKLGFSYYFSNQHKTVIFFNIVQNFAFYFLVNNFAKSQNKKLFDLEVLNIGVGNGQQWIFTDLTTWCPSFNNKTGQMTTSFNLTDKRDKLDWNKITDLDNNKTMLNIASLWYLPQLGRPRQILADASDIPISNNSFDIVIAGLCDHITDYRQFYKEVRRVLKPGGHFILTYPHRELMTIVRNDIYHIDINKTKFNIYGEEIIIDSIILTPEELKQNLSAAKFKIKSAVTLYPYPYKTVIYKNISNTIRQASKIMKTPIRKTPILTLGVGEK